MAYQAAQSTQSAQSPYEVDVQAGLYNHFNTPNLQGLQGSTASGLSGSLNAPIPSGLITVLQEAEKKAASLDGRLNGIRISLFGSQLNNIMECGDAKAAHVPSAREIASSIAKTLDRISSIVASLEQQIGGR